jgi:hypothetical protein
MWTSSPGTLFVPVGSLDWLEAGEPAEPDPGQHRRHGWLLLGAALDVLPGTGESDFRMSSAVPNTRKPGRASTAVPGA